MEPQNYKNHAKFVPLYHFVLFGILVLTLIGSLVNLFHSLADHSRFYNAALICALTVAVLILFFLARVFPLAAQDRAIRAEERLRHFMLTGKPLDPRLSVKQIVALRFASDGEFPDLAKKAAEGSMEPAAIKQAVQNWRADYDRL
jgi:Family of unknown function (DUF6526)